MKNFLKILILPVAITIILGGFASKALAVTPLSVQFVPNPLFNQSNFAPGGETSGEVTVTNNSGATQNILTEAINISDSNNFGSQLHIIITGIGGTLFDNTLANFLSTAGEVSLGTITDGESKVFTYTVSFTDSSGNSYQAKTLGFDVCVGFEGGQTHCGDTVIDDGGGGGGSGGSISGSGGYLPTTLTIFNEQALNITNVGASGSATITWNTNLLSTSQVVFGLASGGPYTLVLTPPDFGYPAYTTEDGTKVINHSMNLTGLTPGATYLYRVISRASPPTVSPEHQFTVPRLIAQVENPLGQALGASAGGEGEFVPGSESSNVPGSVLGDSTGPDGNLATAFTSGFNNLLSICTLISLLILLVLYIIWQLWLRKRYENYGISEGAMLEKLAIFFGVSSLLAVLISMALNKYCTLPVFITSFIVSACFYAYFKLKVK